MSDDSLVDWGLYQTELDAAFHAKEDAFQAGSTEHAELLQFIVRLHKMRQQQRKGNKSSADVENPEAEKLGLPPFYEARFRVNSSVAVDRRRVDKAIRAIERINERLPRAPPMKGEEVVEEYRSMLPWFEDWLQKRQLAKVKKLLADRRQLPMAPYEKAIVETVKENAAVVIAGDTGCGKSTQVPQFLMNAGFKRILCTQPRRISAISLCRRVSHETLNVHGNEVAYKIRFASTMDGGSKIVFMTEGILLRMMSADPQLSSFDVVIIDEVHERHLNTDFLLALLRAVIIQRPEIRIVLMSATINFQAYSDYFGNAPVIKVPGRLYPIQLEYLAPKPKEAADQHRPGDRPERGPRDRRDDSRQRKGPGGRGGEAKVAKEEDSSQDAIDPEPYLKLMQRIDSEVPAHQRGDMLVFVSGMADIVALAESMKQYAQENRRWIVLPLHSSLTAEDQDKVFDTAPEGVRKVIISTNIAETSITIDGVRFVADSGRAKEMIHDVASGGGSLQEGWISRASADQRKGRSGRTGPGKCFRMYSEELFNSFRAFSLPEIQRVRLESVVLQIKALAGSAMNPRHFGFIDPPPEDSLEGAMMNLKQVGALTQGEELTPLGAVLSLLPVDVHIGKLLVLGCLFRIADPILTVAAALSVQSPFARLADDNEEARSARLELTSPHGDAITLMNVFEEWVRLKANGRGSSSRWCRRAGIEEQRLYEMAKLKAQFQELLTDVGVHRLAAAANMRTGEARGKKQQGGARMWGGQLHAAKKRLREMQHERDRERGKKVLKLDGEYDLGAGSEDSSSSEDDVEDMHDLDMRIHVDVQAMFRASSSRLSRSDINLIKYILAVALYPRFTIGDENNKQRRQQDCRFHTASVSDLVVHPSSSMAGSVSDMSSQELLVFVELLETRRQYVCGLTPMWALPPLLLAASSLDTDEECSRWVVDGWLLLRVHDGTGLKLLELICRIRSSVGRLLSERLQRARLPGLKDASQGVANSDQLCAWGSWRSRTLSKQDMEASLHMGLPLDLQQTLRELAESPLSGRVGMFWEGEAAAGGEGASAHTDAECSGQAVTTSGQVVATTLGEESLAEQLALMMEVPSRFTVERLKPGLTTTALYITPDPSTVPPDANPGLEYDGNGVPYKKYGVPLASWLRWASLKGYDSAFALHSLNPAMRKHWICAGCDTKVIGTYDEILSHVSSCEAAQALEPKDLEGGYSQKPQDQARKVEGGAVKAVELADEADVSEQGEGLPAQFGKAGPQIGPIGSTARPSSSTQITADGLYRLERYFMKGASWSRRVAAPPTGDPNRDPRGLSSTAHGDRPTSRQPSTFDRLSHQDAVQGQVGPTSSSLPPPAPPPAPAQSGRLYQCPVCGIHETMTPVQILQHKRTHTSAPP